MSNPYVVYQKQYNIVCQLYFNKKKYIYIKKRSKYVKFGFRISVPDKAVLVPEVKLSHVN